MSDATPPGPAPLTVADIQALYVLEVVPGIPRWGSFDRRLVGVLLERLRKERGHDMTEEQLQAIEARAQAATAGPWRNTIRREGAAEIRRALVNTPNNRPGPRVSEAVVNTHDTPTMANVICWTGPAAGEGGDDRLDAAFIAHAREDVPALVAEVRRLRVLNEGLADRVAAQSELLGRRAEKA